MTPVLSRGATLDTSREMNMPAKGNRRDASNLVLLVERVATVLGDMLVLTDEEAALRAVDWHDFEARMHRLLRQHYGDGNYRLAESPRQTEPRQCLERYFAGQLAAIEEIPVKTGGTPFQREIWSALRKLPVGLTTTYSLLAASIDRPTAIRAAGAANGANPVGIVVPCHRVLGADASLTGYGGGLARKRWLLKHEGVALPS